MERGICNVLRCRRRSSDSRSNNARGNVKGRGKGTGTGSLPIGLLDLVLGRSGADAQLVVELCLLDHRCGLLLLLTAVVDKAVGEMCGFGVGGCRGE
jgi:hypothetical protein